MTVSSYCIGFAQLGIQLNSIGEWNMDLVYWWKRILYGELQHEILESAVMDLIRMDVGLNKYVTCI